MKVVIPPTQIPFPIEGERVTCLGSKLMGRVKVKTRGSSKRFLEGFGKNKLAVYLGLVKWLLKSFVRLSALVIVVNCC